MINAHKTAIEVADAEVPLIRPEDTIGYLESKIDQWRTKIRKNLVVKLKDWMSKLGEASLKPKQKLVMLSLDVIPRLSYPLTQDSYPMGILKDLDSTPRTWIKLNIALFYESAGKEGLGLLQFTLPVPLSVSTWCTKYATQVTSKVGKCAPSSE